MPAKRLPFVKLWAELLENEKIRLLTDSQFRTWTYCLLAGSQQPQRWRFNSIAHAAYVTRRPLKDVRAILDHGFLEQSDDGVWIHDAEEYQDVAPSDLARERSANGPPNGRPTPGDHPPNTRRPLCESSANDDRMVASHARGEMEIEKEKEIEKESPAPSEQPPLGARKRITTIDDAFAAELVDQFWEQCGSREAVRDSIANALGYRRRSDYADQRAFLRNWVRGDAQKAQLRRGDRVVPINRTPRRGVTHA